MAYVKNIRIARSAHGGPCGENCNCPGDPGCPDWQMQRIPMGDFSVEDCIAAGGSVTSCQQTAITQQPGYTPPSAGAPTAAASGGGGAGSILGGVLAGLFGPKPGIVYPPGYQPGMSDTMKIALLGGGALVLVLLLRKRGD